MSHPSFVDHNSKLGFSNERAYITADMLGKAHPANNEFAQKPGQGILFEQNKASVLELEQLQVNATPIIHQMAGGQSRMCMEG